MNIMNEFKEILRILWYTSPHCNMSVEEAMEKIRNED